MSFNSSPQPCDTASKISTLTSAPSGLLIPTIASNSVAGTPEEEVPAFVLLKKRVHESYIWNPDNGWEIFEGG